MEIIMVQGIAGDDFSLSPGERTSRFSDAECIRMFEKGIAVPAPVKIERAVKAPAEKRKK